ncbi:extensin-like [Pimephales promelas]|uniref:extensin-like n=1 Tax=Pimephales promelas TaxID=90988 RepID=UPI001955C85E|nr:extensin-like [Pimephales promelas]
MGIFLFPSPCPSAFPMVERLDKLLSLRQGESSVKELAFKFLYFAEGLNIGDTVLKDRFNTSLKEPVPAWEMGMLGTLSFWQFVGYVYHRGSSADWEGGLPPLGPPPTDLTNCHVPGPPMTPLGRGRRKKGCDPSASYLVEAEGAAAPPEAVTFSLPRQRRRRRAPDASLRPVVQEDPTSTVSRPVVQKDPTLALPSPVVQEDPTSMVPSPVIQEDPTSVVPSLVVQKDPTAVVPELSSLPAVLSEVAKKLVAPTRSRRRGRKASGQLQGPEMFPKPAADSPKPLVKPAVEPLKPPVKSAVEPPMLPVKPAAEPSKPPGRPAAAPKRLALPAPPKRLALPAPPKRFSLPAPPKLLALPAPVMLQFKPESVHVVPAIQETVHVSSAEPETAPTRSAMPVFPNKVAAAKPGSLDSMVATEPTSPDDMAMSVSEPVSFPDPGSVPELVSAPELPGPPRPPELPAQHWSPEQPGPPWPPELPCPSWPPELPDPSWPPELPDPSWPPELPGPPWPPELPGSPWLPELPAPPWPPELPAPPWFSVRNPDPPESPWSVPPAPPWSSARNADPPVPPWLNPPVPPLSVYVF